jgi:Asp-tRNA(Asn)/Glu-tRNA(Gln) amidotransferase A subunit family amidase
MLARSLRLTVLVVALGSALPRAGLAQEFRLLETTIHDVHAAMESGRLTCHALVQGYLDRIEAYDQQGPTLNTIQHLNERALTLADSLDGVFRTRGMAGPLHCVPVLLKDQVETSDMPTSYGSVLFQDFVPLRNATIVERLRDAGAIILAKTTMGEFASRYVGSAYGIIRNAYDPRRNPSGSSGGTGSGIAANFGLVGIGEDTSGSVRGPASVSSLVGLRPTLELVSRHGLMPANPTQDTMGPMTRTVMDAAMVMDVIAGYDPDDPVTARSVGRLPDSYAAGLSSDGLRGARIGVVREPMDPAADPTSEDFKEVKAVVDGAIEELRSLGAEVVDPLELPGLVPLVRDGISNSWETEEATDAYLAQHPNAPYSTLAAILLTGRVNPWRARGLMGVMGKTTNDPGYLGLLKARAALRQLILKAMADLDLDAIVYPTFTDQTTLIAADVLTNPAPRDGYGLGDNRGLSPATGFPALTVPAGFTREDLPVGLEFLGRPFSEKDLLDLGYAFEQGTHHRHPPATTPALNGGS